MRLTARDEERFWAKVEIRRGVNACWPWLAHLSRDNYGRFGVGSKVYDAHVIGYRLQKGPIPKGQLVRHTCDNRACVRGKHLILGSNVQNTADKVARGRHACGLTHPATVFPARTVQKVKRLGELGTSYSQIESKTGVSRSHAWAIVNGRNRGPCKPGEKP